MRAHSSGGYLVYLSLNPLNPAVRDTKPPPNPIRQRHRRRPSSQHASPSPPPWRPTQHRAQHAKPEERGARGGNQGGQAGDDRLDEGRRQQGDARPERERERGRRRGLDRVGQGVHVDAQLVPGVRPDDIMGCQLHRHLPGQPGRHAPGLIDRRQLLQLRGPGGRAFLLFGDLLGDVGQLGVAKLKER